MKHPYLLFLFGLLLLTVTDSCDIGGVSCDDSEVNRAIHELLYQKAVEKMAPVIAAYGMKITAEDLKDFCMNRVKLDMVRTLSEDKELNRRICAARLQILFPPELARRLDSLAETDMEIASIRKPLQIEYAVQETEDGHIAVQVNMSDKDCEDVLARFFFMYLMTKKNPENAPAKVRH